VKPIHGIAIYALIIGGIPLIAILLFLASPDKTALLRVDGRNMGAVTVEVTLHGPEGVWSRKMSAGRKTTWQPIPLKQWTTVSVRCGGDPRVQTFDAPGGRSTLLTVTTAACGYVEVKAEPYP
jgi:hypothetical protein